jgi:hypothetical protein
MAIDVEATAVEVTDPIQGPGTATGVLLFTQSLVKEKCGDLKWWKYRSGSSAFYPKASRESPVSQATHAGNPSRTIWTEIK